MIYYNLQNNFIKKKGCAQIRAYKVIKMKRLFSLLLVVAMIVSFSACVVSVPTVNTISGELTAEDGTVTGHFETEYSSTNQNVIDRFISFKLMDAEQSVLIDLKSDEDNEISYALTGSNAALNRYSEIIYVGFDDNNKEITRETYSIKNGQLSTYEKDYIGAFGIQEYKLYSNGEVIIHEIAGENQGMLVSPSNIGNEIIINVSNAGDGKGQYTKTYNATTGDVISTEYELYDENGLHLGSYTYDAENNKIDEKLTHYVKEYKNNGEATITLYDYKGNELGTVKYSGGYCQAGK